MDWFLVFLGIILGWLILVVGKEISDLPKQCKDCRHWERPKGWVVGTCDYTEWQHESDSTCPDFERKKK
jgi:hypothetical protein